ncbi:MAG: GAF domain-containing protein, partial [Pseudomonadota bacterium]|nr:GAF domain-containing protein [Pseudomonadota bacterium]
MNSVSENLQAPPTTRDQLEERMRFEELLSELSVRLINLGSEEADTALEEGLRLVGKFARADEVRLLSVQERESAHRVAYGWVAKGTPGDLACSSQGFFDRFPLAVELLRAGKPMMYESLDQIPSRAQAERTYLASEGLLAAIAYPVMVDARLLAVLFIHRFQETRWPNTLTGRLPHIASIFGNALARKQAQEDLHRQLEFEELLADISAKFVNPAPQEIDSEIDQTLARLGRFFEADRVFVARFDNDRTGKAEGFTFGWAAPGISGQDPMLEGAAFDHRFPWMTARMRRRDIFHVPVDPLPPEAAAERAYVRQVGIRSSILVPLAVGGYVTGTVVLDSFNEKRRWTAQLAQRLQLVGEIIASALERKRDFQALCKRDRALKHALDEIGVLKDRLEAENLLLREEIELHQSHE